MKDMAKETLAEGMIDLLAKLLVWRPQIERALSHAGWSHSFDDITGMVMRQELLFYTHDGCFSLCQIVHFPAFKNFHFMIVGGDLNRIIELKPFYEDIAKEAGCKHLSFSGRPGWARALKEAGWEHKFTTMWSEIEQ